VSSAAASRGLPRFEERVLLTCEGVGCRRRYEVSARYARAIRGGEYPPLCPDCNKEARCKRKASRVVSEAERRYWIDRFGYEGAVALAQAIWGEPVERTQSIHALAASSSSR